MTCAEHSCQMRIMIGSSSASRATAGRPIAQLTPSATASRCAGSIGLPVSISDATPMAADIASRLPMRIIAMASDCRSRSSVSASSGMMTSLGRRVTTREAIKIPACASAWIPCEIASPTYRGICIRSSRRSISPAKENKKGTNHTDSVPFPFALFCSELYSEATI